MPALVPAIIRTSPAKPVFQRFGNYEASPQRSIDKLSDVESERKPIMYTLRNVGSLIFAVFLGSISGSDVYAQSLPAHLGSSPAPLQNTALAQISAEQGTVVRIPYDHSPDAPGQPTTEQPSGGTISGTVTDVDGAEVPGALVTLERDDSTPERTLTADGAGSFSFAAVEPGAMRLTIRSAGFATWVEDGVVLHSGEIYELPPVALKPAASTEVEVVFSRQDLAEEQMHAQEKQRVVGIFPNFYVSYERDAVPLSTSQKFRLALRMSLDPTTFATAALTAGVEQSQNDFSGYGPGALGYAKRFGASYGDGFTSMLIGDAILPSILHQDPRYLYKGTGSIRSRALYAIASVVICRGDNGHWQPNYSNVFGNLASAGISNIYYPSTDRNGARLTIDNSLLITASGAIGSLLQEFLIRKISIGVQP
jgi:Carboxypeptidase regulatory-like domain